MREEDFGQPIGGRFSGLTPNDVTVNLVAVRPKLKEQP